MVGRHASFSLHNGAISQHPANHVLRDLGIVFQLAAVLIEERTSNVLDACPTIPFKQQSEHHRLVDMRHSHVAFDELN